MTLNDIIFIKYITSGILPFFCETFYPNTAHLLYARDIFACLSVIRYSRENLRGKIFARKSSREKAGFWGHTNAAQAETFRHKPSLISSTEATVDHYHYLSVLQSHENCRMTVHLKIKRKLSLNSR